MSKHIDKANRELMKTERRKLQIQEERLKEKKRLAELHQKILSNPAFNDDERRKLLPITNRQKYYKALKSIKKELNKDIIQNDIEIIKLDAQIKLCEELENQKKQLPQIEDIINSAKHILCTKKRLIQTVKPIIAHLQEQGFNTENLDIAKILLETGEFYKGDWVKLWFFGQPNPIYFYLKQKTIIFWKGIVGFIQKYLPMLYKAVKPKQLNQ